MYKKLAGCFTLLLSIGSSQAQQTPSYKDQSIFPFADVDMATGAFSSKWADMDVGSYKLWRRYLSNGAPDSGLGKEWCFEGISRIDFARTGWMSYHECSLAPIARFEPMPSTQRKLDSLHIKSGEQLKMQLGSLGDARLVFVGPSDNIMPIFMIVSKERLELVKGNHRLGFDHNGRLMTINKVTSKRDRLAKQPEILKLRYAGKNLEAITLESQGKEIKFKSDADGRIVSAGIGESQEVEYKYTDGQLSNAKAAKKYNIDYTYLDGYLNMVTNNKSIKQLIFDKRGALLAMSDRMCGENYEYTEGNDGSSGRTDRTWTRDECDWDQRQRISYQYKWRNVDGQRRLTEYREEILGRKHREEDPYHMFYNPKGFVDKVVFNDMTLESRIDGLKNGSGMVWKLTGKHDNKPYLDIVYTYSLDGVLQKFEWRMPKLGTGTLKLRTEGGYVISANSADRVSIPLMATSLGEEILFTAPVEAKAVISGQFYITNQEGVERQIVSVRPKECMVGGYRCAKDVLATNRVVNHIEKLFPWNVWLYLKDYHTRRDSWRTKMESGLD